MSAWPLSCTRFRQSAANHRTLQHSVRRCSELSRSLALAAGLFLLSSGYTQAADPLQIIPKDVSAVVRLKAPQTTVDDLADFADEIQLGLGAVIEAQAQSPALGTVLGNPSLAGVDSGRDWFLAVSATADSEPHLLIVMPATDGPAMQEAIGDGYFFAEADDWVAYSQNEDLIREAQACLSGDSEAIAGQLPSRQANLVNSGHISVFVNVTHLKTVYSEQLAAADDQLEQFIDMMASQVTAASPEVDIDYVLSMYRDLGTGILQTVRDSESLIVSISIEEDVLQIEELLTVEEGSSTDTLLSSQPVSDLQLLQSLPEGQTGYAATHMNPGPLFGWAETMLTGMIQDEDSREQLLKSLQIFRQAESATIAWGGGVFPDEDEAMRYFAVSRFQPASVMQDAIEVLGDELSYDIGGIHQSMILQRDVAEIDGHSVHRYQIDQELPPALDPLGIQRRINAKLYGQDEITQYLVFRDDTNLQTMGGGTDSMKQLMTADSWTDPGLLAARQRFPDQASLIVLGDLPEFIINMGRLMLESGALPIPIEAETLAGFEVPPSYAGFSVTAEPQHLHARTVIPVGTVQAFAKIAQFAQQAIPGSP